MEILNGCLAAGMLSCAILAIRSSRLVVSSLWLAMLSALLAAFIYLLGATRIAVIELSVGAGLVTVLLVFAVGIAGDEPAAQKPLVPKLFSVVLALAVLGLLCWFVLPLTAVPAPAHEPSLASLLWEGRSLDVLLQAVLIFSGVMGILVLLTQPTRVEARESITPSSLKGLDAEPVVERREVRL